MDHLQRRHAPITDDVWAVLDDEARERLTPVLAVRRLVDFRGPAGWRRSATNLGRTERLPGAHVDGVRVLGRRVLPLIELRASFALAREELCDADRGAADPDLGALDDAARRIAEAENVAVLDGWGADGVVGVRAASPHEEIPAESFESLPAAVAAAVTALVGSGVGGPYALALGSPEFTGVAETAEHGGYPLLDHLDRILDGSVIRAPGLGGGLVISLRGGDFLFDCGQDLSLGYTHHDADDVHLYLEESFSFRVATPEAAVPVRPPVHSAAPGPQAPSPR